MDDGEVQNKTFQSIKGYYPAAIDEETWNIAASLRDKRAFAKNVKHTRSVPNLFTGLAFCCCGAKMIMSSSYKRLKSGEKRWHHCLICKAHKQSVSLCQGNPIQYNTYVDRYSERRVGFEEVVLNFISNELEPHLLTGKKGDSDKISAEITAKTHQITVLKEKMENLRQSISEFSGKHKERYTQETFDMIDKLYDEMEAAETTKNSLMEKMQTIGHKDAAKMVTDIKALIAKISSSDVDTESIRREIKTKLFLIIDKIIVADEESMFNVVLKSGRTFTLSFWHKDGKTEVFHTEGKENSYVTLP